jgi:hypothetical protein
MRMQLGLNSQVDARVLPTLWSPGTPEVFG